MLVKDILSFQPSVNNVNTSTWLHEFIYFDHTVKPVLLYSSEIRTAWYLIAPVWEIIWATSWENLFCHMRTTKVLISHTDQTVHPSSLISAFIICCLDSIISSFYMQNPKLLASLYSWAGQFVSYLVGNPEDRFSHDVAHITLDKIYQNGWKS